MSLYRCCPTNCYDSCCDYMAACAIGLPVSVTYTVEVFCTRKYYVDGNLEATIVTADYEYSYIATDWRTESFTDACGTYDIYKSNTVQFILEGDVADFTSESPTNSGTCGCIFSSCGGTLDPCCSWCGPGCTQCKAVNWEWCTEYLNYDKNVMLEDWEVTYGCCYDDGCYRPCFKWEILDPASATETGGTVDRTSTCCGATPYVPGPFATTHNDFDIIGRCGCLGSNTWLDIKVVGFRVDWTGNSITASSFSGVSPQTTCSGTFGPIAVDRRCACYDFSTTPATYNENICATANVAWIDCCEYTVTVTVV